MQRAGNNQASGVSFEPGMNFTICLMIVSHSAYDNARREIFVTSGEASHECRSLCKLDLTEPKSTSSAKHSKDIILPKNSTTSSYLLD